MYFPLPQYDVSVVPAGWEWQKGESTLTLAEGEPLFYPDPWFITKDWLAINLNIATITTMFK
jgi:hypothetical protein